MIRRLVTRLYFLFGRNHLERQMLTIVALVACLMPARRAASVDPMVALRAQ